MGLHPESRSTSHALTQALAASEQDVVRFRRAFIRRLAQRYDRDRHLRRLLGLLRDLETLPEPELTLSIIARLKRALRASLSQRARRRWTYSRHRHAALLAALGGELLRLKKSQDRITGKNEPASPHLPPL